MELQTQMKEVLGKVNLSHLEENFRREHVTPDIIIAMSERDLGRLGVVTIGERIRLLEACRKDSVAGRHESLNNIATYPHQTQQEQPQNQPPILSSSNIPQPHINSARNYIGAIRERGQLFGSRSTSSSSAGRNVRRSFRSNSNRSSGGQKGQSRTWTRNFYCLANKYALKVPSSSEKEMLNDAGLGLRKIKLDLNDDEEEVFKKLTSDAIIEEEGITAGFPQLKDCGGFELLVCHFNSRDLSVLNCSLAAKAIRAKVAGSQGKIYIRPIQRNLSLRKVREDTKSVLTEKCIICQQDVTMGSLREHIRSCRNYTVSDDSVDEENGYSFFEMSPFSRPLKHLHQAEEDISSAQAMAAVLNEDRQAEMMSPYVDTIDLSSEQDQEIGHNNSTGENAADNANVLVLSGEDAEEPNEDVNRINQKVKEAAKAIKEAGTDQNPVETLRFLQKALVSGRCLEVVDQTTVDNGKTNFIIVDRNNILETGFDEIMSLEDKFVTLEVQFYNEQAEDYGGPRKEFFLMMLREIKAKYFDKGILHAFKDDYYKIGILFGLSVLQNGKIPTFIDEETLCKLVDNEESQESAVDQLKKGLKCMGIVQALKELPLLAHLFRESENITLTMKKLVQLLKPQFAELGSNERQFQDAVYALFLKYLREAASGRRGNISLDKILIFVTGVDEEPVLGFAIHPSIVFVEDALHFLPTASTCINQLRLPRGAMGRHLPETESLYKLYDYAFANSYFGLI